MSSPPLNPTGLIERRLPVLSTSWISPLVLALALLLATSGGCAKLKVQPDMISPGKNGEITRTSKPPTFDPKIITEAIDPGPPSHNRPWKIEQAVLPFAEITTAGVTIRNVRECRWKSETEKSVQHTDWNFAWDDIEGVDFVVVPFKTMPLLAHTMLSFRLKDGRAMVVSVEARLEHGEAYSPWAGAARQFELMYVIGDEQDLYGLRANARRDDIFLYPSTAHPEQASKLLKNILIRTNAIAAQPEYYDSLTNNCTTNIIDHVLQLREDNSVRLQMLDQWRSRFPGNSDRMAYDLGLLQTDQPFEDARTNAWVSSRIRQHIGQDDFSVAIRGKNRRTRL